MRMNIKGKGKYSSEGTLESIESVEELQLREVDEIPYDPSARPIEEVLAELAGEVPEEEWEKLPADLSKNLDHYLYGTPKR